MLDEVVVGDEAEQIELAGHAEAGRARDELVVQAAATGERDARVRLHVLERLDDESGPLVALEPERAEDGVAERTRVQVVEERSRVVHGLGDQAVVAGEPVGDHARRAEQPDRLGQGPGVPLAQQALELEALVVETEVGPRAPGAVVRGPVLVGEPHHLARVLDEVRREVDADDEVAVERHHPPRQRRLEDPLAVPHGGEAHQLGPVTGGVARVDEVVHVDLGAATDERDLGSQHADVHRGGSYWRAPRAANGRGSGRRTTGVTVPGDPRGPPVQ